MNLPKRKQIRLPDYDYSAPGAYFVTICTHEKRCILSTITVGDGVLDVPCVRLSPYGKIVEETLREIVNTYSWLSLDRYVIMPNHIHLLLRIRGNGPSGTPAPTREAGNGPSGTPAPTREAGTGPSGTPAPTREAGNGPSGTPAPTRDTDIGPSVPANAALPRLISTLKRFTNKKCGTQLWQRSYHEHVIRGEADYRQIWEYITTNPVRWAEDRYFSP